MIRCLWVKGCRFLFFLLGVGSALFAYHSLHYHIKDKLTEISHMLVLTQEEMDQKYLMTGLITSVDAEKLIMGALEKAFLAMDEEIQQERYDFRIEGGCTALVSLFMKGIDSVLVVLFVSYESCIYVRQIKHVLHAHLLNKKIFPRAVAGEMNLVF